MQPSLSLKGILNVVVLIAYKSGRCSLVLMLLQSQYVNPKSLEILRLGLK